MDTINIEGKQYEVVRNNGFLGGGRFESKNIKTDAGEKTVVKERGEWRFWNTTPRMLYQGEPGLMS